MRPDLIDRLRRDTGASLRVITRLARTELSPSSHGDSNT
jgi:hypothetical protein